MISILGYGVRSAAGRGTAALWRGLTEGRDFGRDGVCRMEGEEPAMRDRLVGALVEAFGELGFENSSSRLGVIFASSKGCLEDFIWEKSPSLGEDPLAPVLTEFLRRTELSPARRIGISNACASSHSALFLARAWLSASAVEEVLVLAADGIGPFVENGFRSLGAMTATRARPFAPNRDGLQLGEGAAVLWLSTRAAGPLCLKGVGLDAEGYAVTRPSESGASLKRAVGRCLGKRRTDLVIAHGTATAANDAAEDCALAEFFEGDTPPVTATKWSIGHSLGASGLVDAIAACEAIRHRHAFPLGNTEVIDPSFRAQYLVGRSVSSPRDVLVTSLGFGGVHAAIHVGAGQ
jgi:3-oxoacyl-[acyl-carrier-protein] synthase-1